MDIQCEVCGSRKVHVMGTGKGTWTTACTDCFLMGALCVGYQPNSARDGAICICGVEAKYHRAIVMHGYTARAVAVADT